MIGIDYNSSLIENANYNFSLFKDVNSEFKFYADDMRKFVKNHENIQADMLSLPNIINYISKNDFIEFLINCKNNNLYKEKADFFIRFRTPKDFRFGSGKRINEQTYMMEADITGENGALNCFYREVEMIDILEKYLNLSEYKVFNIDFENIASNGDTILNSDIIVWGKIN